MLTMSLLVAVSLAAVPVPQAGSTPSNPVEFEVIKELALRKAEAEWPGSRLGPVTPYLSPDGSTIAYMFHFTVDRAEFPGFERLESDIGEEAKRLGPNVDLTSWTSKYSYVLVSATYDRPPILTYGYGTSDYYAVGRSLMEKAAARLGDIVGVRVFFVFPCNYFEFEAASGERLVLASQSGSEWPSTEAFAREFLARREELNRRYVVDPVQERKLHRQEWVAYLGRDFIDSTRVYVPDADLCPFYDWSYGCTPSAAAMLMGYIDRSQDYGRLVDWFWQRYDMVEGEMDWQTPNVQRELALAMRTDSTSGGTQVFWIRIGLETVAQNNGYNFTTVVLQGHNGNDWGWSTLTEEIDAGYAHVWSALWAIHSLTALGYRTPEKDVYVHNTWWKPAAWWHYSGDGTSHIDSPHPSGGDPHKLIITHPLGDTGYNSTGSGERLQVGDTVDVTWDNFGNPGTRVEIELSRDGGKTWQMIESNTPDDGIYEWYIPPDQTKCDSCRLRLSQYNNSMLTSGDGSFGCFKIQREPPAPLQSAPPNGMQIFDPPVILEVCSLPTGADSIEYVVVYGEDTIWRERSIALTCSLPDTIFYYRRNHKWYTRAHNRFGWGEYGTPWSFWIRFTGVEEIGTGFARIRFDVPALGRLGEGIVFHVSDPSSQDRVELFDAAGVKRRELVVDNSRVAWDGCGVDGDKVSAGLYFARLVSGQMMITRKFLLTY